LTEGEETEDEDDEEEEGEGKDPKRLCLARVENKATLVPCEDNDLTYTPLHLQFASESDIATMTSPSTRIIGAASDGDKKMLQELLKESDAGPDVKGWDGVTPLITASSMGHLEVVKFLLKEGADVNLGDKDGVTAFMEACVVGHNKVVDALLEAGAHVDTVAKSGVTALWLASSEGQLETIKKLLENGANASDTRNSGASALMAAAMGGYVEVLRVLLQHGADAAATDDDGLTPLMSASENGTLSCVEVLVKDAKVDDVSAYINMFSHTGYSALVIASAHGHKGVVEFLLENGADVNAADVNTKVTPLMYAAAGGHVDVVKVLLSHGADISILHNNGGTALLEAATGGETEAMELLLQTGAAYDFVDLDGVTPLMAVASQGDPRAQDIVLDYLRKDKNAQELTDHINMASYSGGTAVMFAAAGGHEDCTKQLIDLGADVNAIARATPDYMERLQKMIEDGSVENPDDHVNGVTALHVAAQGGHLEVVEMLIRAGANVNVVDDEKRTALILAVKANYGDVAIELVRAGADPKTVYVDDDGETHNMLMDAITVENKEFALMLIEKGADLHYKDERGVSTLLQASHRGLLEVAEALVAKNTKDDFVDGLSKDGMSPLIAASSEGHLEVAKLLIEKGGADVNAKDRDGTNSLMAASSRGHLKITQLLLDSGAKVNEQNTDGHTALMFAYNGKAQVETLWERYAEYLGEEEGGDSKEGATGPILREALESHGALVDLLMKSGADPNLKDKEGRIAKDFDFNPEADADVLKRESKAETVRDESKNEL